MQLISEKLQNNKAKKNKKLIKRGVAILYVVALVIVIVGSVAMHYTSGYTAKELFENVIGNLLGILVSFLIFDIFYNYLTQEEYTEQVSQSITKTLMGDPDVLDSFSVEDRKEFISSTIRSIVDDEDAVEVTNSKLKYYFDYEGDYKIRKNFSYSIDISTEEPNGLYEGFPGKEKCFFVQETFDYTVKILKGENPSLKDNIVKIAFLFDKRALDEGMLSKNESEMKKIKEAGEKFSNCIFSENLDIPSESLAEILKYKDKSDDEQREYINDLLTPVIKIDSNEASIDNVFMNEQGIVVYYKVKFDTTAAEHDVRVIFHMPKQWDSIFEVAIVDPTYAPKISFNYVPMKMDVTMYPFLNKEFDANVGAYEERNGLFDIAIKDDWLYPKSGVVFFVRKKIK